MFDPNQLTQLLNKHLGCDVQVISSHQPLPFSIEDDAHALLFADRDFQIWGSSEERHLAPFIHDLMYMLTDAASKTEPKRQWIDFLSGRSRVLPTTPAILPAKAYRICRITHAEPALAGEIQLLSVDVLGAELLCADESQLHLLVEDQTNLAETLGALYETLITDFSQTANVFLSSRSVGVAGLHTAYLTLEKMSELEVSATPGPVVFESEMAELALSEWLNSEKGPILQAVRAMGISTQLDDEALRTIDALFKMNLNLTDTARALFIHRNTLIYRLDKLQKQLGFDLRSFEDCYKLKLLLKIK